MHVRVLAAALVAVFEACNLRVFFACTQAVNMKKFNDIAQRAKDRVYSELPFLPQASRR